MAKLGTFCKECCFYKKENKSCQHGLIETFKQRGADVSYNEEGVVIDRVCRYRKDNDWNAGFTAQEKIDAVNKEVRITGSIILIVDDVTDLEGILKNLKDLTRNDFNLVISYKNKLSDVLELTKSVEIPASFVKSINQEPTQEQRVHDCLKQLKNGYIFILDASKEIDYTIFDKVNYFINRLMYRVLHVKGESDSLHHSVSMAHIYKWLNGDLIDSFANKLMNIAAEESSDPQVFTWDVINEEYLNNI